MKRPRLSNPLVRKSLITKIIVGLIESVHKFKDHKKGITEELHSGYAEILSKVIKEHIEKVEPEGLSWECIG
jgi:hypothetical protein